VETGHQAKNKLVEMLLDAVSQPVILAGMDGSVVYMNSACAGTFGIMDLTALKVSGIIDVPLEVVCTAAAREEKHHEQIPVKLNTVHGFLGAELSAAVLNDDIPGLLLTLNVTGSPEAAGGKSAQAALLESEARNRTLIAAIPDIIFRVNSKGEYLDRMLKGKINEIFPQEIAVRVHPFITRAVETREISIFEYPVSTGGSDMFYEARFVAMDEDEILVILRNVTERKNAMMEMESARREAEQANNAKSEFLANMSHEIRTPLNSITGFIELLMRGRLDEAQKEYLGIIKKSASNLLDIINDILDFSKIESHKLDLSFVEFDPYAEFESVIKLFDVKAKEKGVRFSWFMDPDIPSAIVSDPLRLKQVMANLISNAIKFTPDDGAVSAEIRLKYRDETGCSLYFSVTDTGIGIPERKQKQIFEAFTQADNSITRRFGGTGLGLSISSNLVKLLGGELVLESEPGRGSCFSFMVDCGAGCAAGLSQKIDLSGINAGIYAASPAERLIGKGFDWFIQRLGCKVLVSASQDELCRNNLHLMLVISTAGDTADFAHRIKSSGCRILLVCTAADMELVSRWGDYISGTIVLPASADSMIKSLLSAMDMEAESMTGHSEASVHRGVYAGRVLIGEDNKINQKLMTLLLRDYGIETEVAGNGLDVFDRYRDGKFDLILMDVNMPVADGLETTRMIREYEESRSLPPIPIVALTAKALKGDREILLQNGMDGYLAKPVEIERLEAVLTAYLDQGTPRVNEITLQKTPCLQQNDYNIAAVADELRIPAPVLSELCVDFFSDTLESLAEMRNAAIAADLKLLKRLGHKLKGASANLRFSRLSGYFSEIEEKSDSGDKAFDYAAQIDHIDNEMSRLKSFF